MKRDHKPKHDGLFPVFTFFEWNQCCKCGKDFRRESGWQFWTGPYYAGRGGLKYLCRECAPTEDDAQREREDITFDFAGAIDRIPKSTIEAYADYSHGGSRIWIEKPGGRELVADTYTDDEYAKAIREFTEEWFGIANGYRAVYDFQILDEE